MSAREGPQAAPEAPIGPGWLVLVVGPSGAGKDTLITGVRDRTPRDPRLVFPVRVVTRPADATEASRAVCAADFAEAAVRQAFALSWHAHGLGYGIPVAIHEAIERGCIVVCNVSRTVVAAARSRYANTFVVYVDAAPAIRAQRLSARGREDGAAIARRLDRDTAAGIKVVPDLVIRNDRSVAGAVARLAAALDALSPAVEAAAAGP